MFYNQGLGETLAQHVNETPPSCPPSTTSSKAFLNGFIQKHILRTIKHTTGCEAGTSQLYR